jgi:hypothetical protein
MIYKKREYLSIFGFLFLKHEYKIMIKLISIIRKACVN